MLDLTLWLEQPSLPRLLAQRTAALLAFLIRSKSLDTAILPAENPSRRTRSVSGISSGTTLMIEQLGKAPLTLGSVIGVVPAGGGFAQDRLHDEKAIRAFTFAAPPRNLPV